MIQYKKPRYTHVHKDRHGKTRIYLRKPGRAKVALPGPLGSEEFWKAYHAAMAGEDVAKAPAVVIVKKGTIDALITEYYASPAFTSKATATQRNYKSSLEPFRIEYGNLPVAGVKAKHFDAILGKIAARSTAQAHNLRKRLVKLMALAVKWEYRGDNPMLTVERVQHKTKGYENWTEGDIAKFRAHWDEGTPQRIAFEILLYTGLRRSDAVRLGRQHIQNDHIVMKTKKSGETVELNIPVHQDFNRTLKTIEHSHLNLIVTAHGAARSEKAFTNWIIDAAKEAGLPAHRSPHGLRKASFTRLAEAGCSATEMRAITGHKNLEELEVYVKAADQKKMAKSAITKTFGAL